MAVSMTKFQCFVEDVAKAKHDFTPSTGHNVYAQLLATEPSASADFVETDLPADLATNYGYTAGGVDCGKATTSAQSGGLYTLKLADKVITASGGNIGPFQYVALLNNTSSTKPLIGYYNYGSSITINDGETFTINFDDTNGVLTLQ